MSDALYLARVAIKTSQAGVYITKDDGPLQRVAFDGLTDETFAVFLKLGHIVEVDANGQMIGEMPRRG